MACAWPSRGMASMRKRTLLLALAFVVSALPSFAQQVVVGQAGAAYYKAAVPPNWNGTLVIWNHGFDLDPIEPFTIEPPTPANPYTSLDGLGDLAPLQLSEGYAVAASSYSLPGWALFQTKNDLEALVEAFSSRFARPGAGHRHRRLAGRGGDGRCAREREPRQRGRRADGVRRQRRIAQLGRRAGPAADLRRRVRATCPARPSPAAAKRAAEESRPDAEATWRDAVNACTGVLDAA